jgi:iron complex transport system ATP-binding protein
MPGVATPPAPPALALRDVRVVRDGRALLDGIDWVVEPSERWVVLGANGSGKSTLVRVAALDLHPTSGTVEVLGQTLGRTDVRSLRRRIGWASAALADALRPGISAADTVMTAKNGALEPWWHTYDDDDRARAVDCLGRVGIAHLADRLFGTLSSGERQRVLVARTLMNDVGVVLLDEPAAGLDLGGREALVDSLGRLAGDPASAPTVLVTHHVEEIAPGFDRALLLRDGVVVAAGPTPEVLTSARLSDAFGLKLRVERSGDRYRAALDTSIRQVAAPAASPLVPRPGGSGR